MVSSKVGIKGLPGAQASISAFLDKYPKSNSSYLMSNSVNFFGMPTVSDNFSISEMA